MSQDVTSASPVPKESLSNDEALGIAGRSARFFIRSPLSPLFYVAMLLMGLLGLVLTPRQEDPQISVPMIDIMVQYPGASAQQVANLAMQPLERIMSEIPGVKHVYSASQRSQGMVTVEFDVGQPMGPSLVKVNDKLASQHGQDPTRGPPAAGEEQGHRRCAHRDPHALVQRPGSGRSARRGRRPAAAAGPGRAPGHQAGQGHGPRDGRRRAPGADHHRCLPGAACPGIRSAWTRSPRP